MGEVTIKINTLLTFNEEHIKVFSELNSLFVKESEVMFDYQGHMFIGILKKNAQTQKTWEKYNIQKHNDKFYNAYIPTIYKLETPIEMDWVKV